jgi:hypothetical protein
VIVKPYFVDELEFRIRDNLERSLPRNSRFLTGKFHIACHEDAVVTETGSKPKSLPNIVAVDILLLGGTCESEKSYRFMEEYKILKTTHLTGLKALKIVSLWENCTVTDSSIQCPHMPRYGVRFYNSGAVTLEATVCWESFTIKTKRPNGASRFVGSLVFGEWSDKFLRACLNNGFPHPREIGIRTEFGMRNFLAWIRTHFTK